MSIYFQTIRSSSSGNLVTLWTQRSRLVIDVGIRTQRELRSILQNDIADPAPEAFVISHLHGDHVNYHSLRVLESHGRPIYVHGNNADELLLRHSNGKPFKSLSIRKFADVAFSVGDFDIQPFDLPHDDDSWNSGFVITCRHNGFRRKIVMATDFHDWSLVAEYFYDADLIYVEANHCPELLRLNPNPASIFHLSNQRTGALLARVIEQSRRPPQMVVLGHLSRERNQPERAMAAVRAALKKNGKADYINIQVAPCGKPSSIFPLVDTVSAVCETQMDFFGGTINRTSP